MAGLDAFLDKKHGLWAGEAVHRAVNDKSHHILLFRGDGVERVGFEIVIVPDSRALLIIQFGERMPNADALLTIGESDKRGEEVDEKAAAAAHARWRTDDDDGVGIRVIPSGHRRGRIVHAGPPIRMLPAEESKYYADPFATHTPQAGGHGMGLKQLMLMMDSHHGDITIAGTFQETLGRCASSVCAF